MKRILMTIVAVWMIVTSMNAQRLPQFGIIISA